MSDAASSPASTVAELQRQLQQQKAENARLAKRNQSLEKAKRDLFEQLRLLIENRFGPSSEKYRVEQADMFFNEAETLAAETEEPPPAAAPKDEDDAQTEAGRCRRQSSS
ncbi:IS66 family transposase, partial [Halospina sp. K52047b]